MWPARGATCGLLVERLVSGQILWSQTTTRNEPSSHLERDGRVKELPFGVVGPEFHDKVLWIGEEVVFVVFVLDQILLRLCRVVALVVVVVARVRVLFRCSFSDIIFVNVLITTFVNVLLSVFKF